MAVDLTPWQKAVQFHGHSCAGLAIGFRVAEAAMRALGSTRDVDEEMVAVVENDSCAVDAIQVVTGCTFGKGNLIFKDFGKQAYTFALRPGGKAVRITVKKREDNRNTLVAGLRGKVSAGEATPEEKILLGSLVKEVIEDLLHKPEDEVLNMREINFTMPDKARIFASVQCACCGEQVMEPRARVKNGQITCIPCSGTIPRGG